MKKIRIISIIAAIIILMLPLACLAEDPEPGSDAATELQLDSELEISSSSPKTLAEGYMPSAVSGNNITVRLPLKGNIEIVGNVTVSPSIASDDTAFYPSNLIRTLSQIQNGTSEYAEFTLATKATCYDGVYPVGFTAGYYDEAGTYSTKSFTIFARITGNPAPTETTEPSSHPVSMPKLMVTGYTITPEDVMAGESMDLTLSVKNMSKRAALNVELSLTSDGAVFLPKGGTNSAFIAKLKGGEEKSISFSFDVKPDAEPAPASITVEIKYEDAEVNSASDSTLISIPVNQPIRIRISDVSATGSTFDSPMSASLTVVNMGKSSIYNLSAEISGEGLYNQSSYYGGTLAAGEQKSVDIIAYAEQSGEDLIQSFSGTVTVSYEDVNGKVFTEVKDFSVDMTAYVEEEYFDPEYEEEQTTSESSGLWWLWVLIGVSVVAGLIVFLVIRNKKRKKAIEDELL